MISHFGAPGANIVTIQMKGNECGIMMQSICQCLHTLITNMLFSSKDIQQTYIEFITEIRRNGINRGIDNHLSKFLSLLITYDKKKKPILWHSSL